MNNLNTLILGQTGSGKTSFAKRMAAITPRAFLFDPRDDYEHVPAYYDFASAAAFYAENHARPFHLVYRGPIDTYVAWLDLLFQGQRIEGDPPLGIFLEESSLYSSSYKIDDYLERVYTQGRRQQISVVTVTQRDTQIHPIIRANSHVWLSMRQRKFSSDVREIFTGEELDRITALERYTPMHENLPEEGKHYVIDPPDFPIFEKWADIMKGGNNDDSISHP